MSHVSAVLSIGTWFVSASCSWLLVRLDLLSLDLCNQGVDVRRRELLAELWHAVLAVSDDVAESIGRNRGSLVRDKRGARHEAAFGSFAMTLCAILLID